MNVYIQNQQKKTKIHQGRLRRAAERTLKAGKENRRRSVNVLVTDDRKIAELHWRYMKIQGPTDVMAFGMCEGKRITGDSQLLGDVVVSVDTAKRMAKRLGLPIHQEIERYVVHGILHLLGYRDDTQAKARVMHRKQEEILLNHVNPKNRSHCP